MNFISVSLKKGIVFFKSNPQIIYTAILLLIIPAAFLFSNQQFLNVAKFAQERLEKERIGIFQDVLATFATGRLDEQEFLQKKIEGLKKQNETFVEIKVIKLENNLPKVIASLIKEEIGSIDEKNQQYFAAASLNPSGSFVFENFIGNERNWKAARAILEEDGSLSGFLVTTISMTKLDQIIAKNIQQTYYFLIVILIVILFLLIRQARLIDYSTLYKQLQGVDKMKDDFISIAAHELRTPLTAIKGYADLVSEISGLSESDKQRVERIKISADRLTFLVNDILDVSRLSQGRMVFNFQISNISGIIEKTIEILKIEADKKGLSLEYKKSVLPHISIDPIRFEQAMVNLIGNAIKYTSKGKIEIFTSQENKKLYIRVADTGFGISAEDQKHLFEKFFRIQNQETREIIGTGLGLWITKELIEKMGGTIMIESIKGVGAHFIISFLLK